MGGWAFDDDDLDERSRLEAENAERQARHLSELIRQAVASPGTFELTLDLICELHRVGMEGLVEEPGGFRTRDTEIFSSQHEPPAWQQVRQLMAEACAYINESEQDALHLAAYALWRINWIHPFDDGNGRAARAVAYVLLCVWNGSELPGEVTLLERLAWVRNRYYRALEHADRGWADGRLDVTELQMLLRELLTQQLESLD